MKPELGYFRRHALLRDTAGPSAKTTLSERRESKGSVRSRE